MQDTGVGRAPAESDDRMKALTLRYTLTSKFSDRKADVRGEARHGNLVISPAQDARARSKAGLVEGDYWTRAERDGQSYSVFVGN